jgi:hypothetical protein
MVRRLGSEKHWGMVLGARGGTICCLHGLGGRIDPALFGGTIQICGSMSKSALHV